MLIAKKNIKSRFTQANSQDGVTLMLAVLVLSVVVAVAFSLATIVFVEIKVSGDVLRTEPAMYASLGVTEEALFQYKRFITPSDFSGFDVSQCEGPYKDICQINHVSLTMPGTQPIQYDDSPKIQVVPRRTKMLLPMYLVNDFTRQYSDVKVEMLPIGSGVDLGVNLNLTDINNVETQQFINNVQISEGGTPFEFSSFDNTDQYDLVLDNSTNNVDVTVSISTVREGNLQPAGLPYTGEQVLRIMANYLGLTRTYQVRIPIP